MKKLLIASFIPIVIGTLSFSLFAQNVAINTTGAPADPSAGLDVSFTSKGLLMPRMTTIQRDSIGIKCSCTPAQGLMIFNTSDNCLEIYLGGRWSSLSCTCIGAPSSPGAIAGSSALCASSTGNIYTVSSVFGATYYKWTVPSGSVITSGQGTPSINMTCGSNSGNVTVYDSNSCGSSSSQSLTLTVSASVPSAPGNISGNTTVCGNASGVTYSISPVSGATSYTWSVPAGATITGGQGSTSVTVTFGSSSGNISVTASNNCGAGSASTQAVTVSPTVNCSALSGWSYREAVTINNSANSSNLTNFQVMLTMNTQALISSGQMRSDGGDIRFTDNNGCTQLYSWIESGINTSGTIIWVKVPSVTANTNYTIYVNYGNSSAAFDGNYAGEAPQISGTYAQYDNGTNVFNNYWNFAGNSLPSPFIVGTSSGSYSVSNRLTISSSSGNENIWTGSTTYNPETNILDMYWYTNGGVQVGYQQGSNGAGGSSYGYYFNSGNPIPFCNFNGGYGCMSLTGSTSSYAVLSQWITASQSMATFNYGTVLSNSSNFPSLSSVPIGMIIGGGGSIFLQWLRTRVVPPNGTMPSTSFGSEQSVCY